MYLRGMIQTKLFKQGSRIMSWLHLAIIALIGGIIQGVAVFVLLLPMANITITFGGLNASIQVIGLVGGIALFTVFGFLNSWIFNKTQHILPAAIVQAAVLGWFLVTFMVPL